MINVSDAIDYWNEFQGLYRIVKKAEAKNVKMDPYRLERFTWLKRQLQQFFKYATEEEVLYLFDNVK